MRFVVNAVIIRIAQQVLSSNCRLKKLQIGNKKGPATALP